MTRYDLLLTQNTGDGVIEFEEKTITIAKGTLIVGQDGGGITKAPVALAPGDNGHVLTLDSADHKGLKWAAIPNSHEQNTDEGTDSMTFYIGGSTKGAVLRKEPHAAPETGATGLEVMNNEKSAYIPIKADTGTFVTSAFAGTDNDPFMPLSEFNNHALTTKAYVDGLLAANDAMLFKGVIDASGNPNYPAATRGDTYKFSPGGKIGGASGKEVEVGDMMICHAETSAAGTHATVGGNWGIIQSNIVGAVTTAETSSSSGDLALFTDSPNAIKKLGMGTDGQVLKMKTVGEVLQPAWDSDVGFTSPMTARGDIIVGLADPAGGATRLGKGAQHHVLIAGADDLDYGQIADANISASAEIALSKLQKSAQIGGSGSAGLSVVGRDVDSAGDFAEIKAGADDTVLIRQSDTLTFNKVTRASIENQSPLTILGNNSKSTAGSPSALTSIDALNVLLGDYGGVPQKNNSVGVTGQMARDANFIYLCVGGGAEGSAIWHRSPIAKATWDYS